MRDEKRAWDSGLYNHMFDDILHLNAFALKWYFPLMMKCRIWHANDDLTLKNRCEQARVKKCAKSLFKSIWFLTFSPLDFINFLVFSLLLLRETGCKDRYHITLEAVDIKKINLRWNILEKPVTVIDLQLNR